ncbi:MAG TPA: hypothetical protein VI934_00845 [Candidatus Nanoarchaeia archaeon]|nr:hypothetical protein [Candidatus Nanoarchaeia archaeon]
MISLELLAELRSLSVPETDARTSAQRAEVSGPSRWEVYVSIEGNLFMVRLDRGNFEGGLEKLAAALVRAKSYFPAVFAEEDTAEKLCKKVAALTGNVGYFKPEQMNYHTFSERL